jgi:hypothetical protein
MSLNALRTCSKVVLSAKFSLRGYHSQPGVGRAALFSLCRQALPSAPLATASVNIRQFAKSTKKLTTSDVEDAKRKGRHEETYADLEKAEAVYASLETFCKAQLKTIRAKRQAVLKKQKKGEDVGIKLKEIQNITDLEASALLNLSLLQFTAFETHSKKLEPNNKDDNKEA